MTTFSTTTIEAYIAKHAYRTMMILHDDFDRHETYVLCKKPDDTFAALIYVAGDDLLRDLDAPSAAEALAYLMSTAFCTYACGVSPREDDTHAMLITAEAMRAATRHHIAHNVKSGCTSILGSTTDEIAETLSLL